MYHTMPYHTIPYHVRLLPPMQEHCCQSCTAYFSVTLRRTGTAERVHDSNGERSSERYLAIQGCAKCGSTSVLNWLYAVRVRAALRFSATGLDAAVGVGDGVSQLWRVGSCLSV